MTDTQDNTKAAGSDDFRDGAPKIEELTGEYFTVHRHVHGELRASLRDLVAFVREHPDLDAISMKASVRDLGTLVVLCEQITKHYHVGLYLHRRQQESALARIKKNLRAKLIAEEHSC